MNGTEMVASTASVEPSMTVTSFVFWLPTYILLVTVLTPMPVGTNPTVAVPTIVFVDPSTTVSVIPPAV